MKTFIKIVCVLLALTTIAKLIKKPDITINNQVPNLTSMSNMTYVDYNKNTSFDIEINIDQSPDHEIMDVPINTPEYPFTAQGNPDCHLYFTYDSGASIHYSNNSNKYAYVFLFNKIECYSEYTYEYTIEPDSSIIASEEEMTIDLSITLTRQGPNGPVVQYDSYTLSR